MLIKKVLGLTAPQWAWLQQEAARLGIRWPELVRRIIDAARESEDRHG